MPFPCIPRRLSLLFQPLDIKNAKMAAALLTQRKCVAVKCWINTGIRMNDTWKQNNFFSVMINRLRQRHVNMLSCKL